MDNFNKEEIINHAREFGYWLQRDVQMDRKQFMQFCNHIARPWSWKIHDMHGEGDLNEEEIVDWSSETRFMKRSLPWHADNPWSKNFQFPLRVFYAVNIPDPKDGPLEFLNQTKWFESLEEKQKADFRKMKVLVQCYKGNCQPYYDSFVKINPITGTESLKWGSKVVYSDVHGLQPDEGHAHNHFSYTMAIMREREIISDEEISTWFQDMIDKGYHDIVEFKEGDLLVNDNWTTFHYRRTLTNPNERLLYRKTLLQPWQPYIG